MYLLLTHYVFTLTGFNSIYLSLIVYKIKIIRIFIYSLFVRKIFCETLLNLQYIHLTINTNILYAACNTDISLIGT